MGGCVYSKQGRRSVRMMNCVGGKVCPPLDTACKKMRVAHDMPARKEPRFISCRAYVSRKIASVVGDHAED